MSAAIQRFRNWLSAPVDGHVIGLFRLVFGAFMVFYAIYLYRIGFIPEGLLKPRVLFKYDYLEWLPLLPAPGMYAVLALMGAAALLLTLGVFFRWACWIFSVCLAFLFFQEKSYYNNHIYLFILLPLLLSATDADRFFSLRSKDRPFSRVPRWQQFILQAQIVIVYFFAGVVKWKADWLIRQEPMTSLIRQFSDAHWLAPLLKHDINILLFTYGGFVLDIVSPILLWYKPVRNWAWIPFVLFHLSNSQIFDDISIFPFVMMGAMILFFETAELPLLRRLANTGTGKAVATPKKTKGNAQKTALDTAVGLPATRPWIRRVLVAYFAWQLLFPLRGFLLPNPLDYTTIGNRFAWRVKADIRKPDGVKFTVQDGNTRQEYPVDIATFLNPAQIRGIASDPRMARDFAIALRSEAAKQGVQNPVVRASIRFGYNGRPPQDFVDPKVDLASAPYSPFKRLDWVVSLPDD